MKNTHTAVYNMKAVLVTLFQSSAFQQCCLSARRLRGSVPFRKNTLFDVGDSTSYWPKRQHPFTRRVASAYWLSSSSSSSTRTATHQNELKQQQQQQQILTLHDVEAFRTILNNQPGSLFYCPQPDRLLANNNNNGSTDNDTVAVVSKKQQEEKEAALIVQDANTDWTKHWKGNAPLVLRPSSTEQVAAILQYCCCCNQQQQQQRKGPSFLSVVPQSGKTGLVGGSVPTCTTTTTTRSSDSDDTSQQQQQQQDAVILQMSRLNRIESLDPVSGILKCQAGCVLQDLQEYCQARDHLVPVDLGAKGQCQIGGNLATNAGGQYYYHYGSLAGNLVGLQVVLADGQILDLNYEQRTNLKDNTGYKLHQLFVGSEGTLGIITGVALLCPRYPVSKQAAILACPTYENVLAVIQSAKTHLGEILAALEFMDERIWQVIEQTKKHHSMPQLFDDEEEKASRENYYYILVETHGSNEEHDQAKMEAFLELAMGDEHVSNGVIAQDLNQLQNFWTIRESANPTVADLGYTYKYDVSLPVSQFADFIQEMRDRLYDLGPETINTNWGHILDGNLHFNVTTVGQFEKQSGVVNILEPYIFEAVLRRGGSISAEHGLGQMKNHLLNMVHDRPTLQMMKRIKEMFDPKGILNPGKFLPIE